MWLNVTKGDPNWRRWDDPVALTRFFTRGEGAKTNFTSDS